MSLRHDYHHVLCRVGQHTCPFGKAVRVGKPDLLERLDRGPCFLLLGQRYLSINTGSDPLIGSLGRVVGRDGMQRGVYQTILSIETDQRQAAFKALTNAGHALVLPPPVRTALEFPWNGVLSSAVDPAWRTGLQLEWRTVQQSVPQRDRTQVSRNVNDLQALMLFGGVDQPPDEQPPSTRPKLTHRQAIAGEALGRVVSDGLTPRGLLVVEGWGLDDWLTPASLFAQICDAVPGQVHIFSATDEILADDHIREAIDLGVLSTHRESFASVLVEARSMGRLTQERPVNAHGHALRVGDRLLPIDRSRWQRILPHARPVDVDLLSDPPAESVDLRYQKFRQFLGTSDGSPAWWAHARRLPFQRLFEPALSDLVEQTIGSRDQRGPLLVAGQSGTGKSVALARLAFQTARVGRRVVLHIPRRTTRPEYEALDDFCLWAEEQSGESTLIVWDGMLEPQDYQRLFDYLRSRGRRIVVVGSCYWDENLFGNARKRSPGRKGKSTTTAPRYVRGRDFIEAPATLTARELPLFAEYLASFGIRLRSDDKRAISQDNTFLSALYRLLPEAQASLRSGLTLELQYSERRLSIAARKRMEFVPINAMQYALMKANYIDGLEVRLHDSENVPSGTEDSPYERLLSLILLVHSHGLRMPLELVLRTIGRDGVRNLPDLLSDIDIIRWDEDDLGNYTLGGRNQLEAKLLTQARGSKEGREAAQIAEVIECVRPDARARNGGSEIDFVIELLTRIGPQVDREQRMYGPYYLEFADSIASLRMRVSDPVVHARLTHKEVNLRREWAVKDQGRKDTDPEVRRDALETAQIAVDEALYAAEEMVRRPQIMLNLYVEQASVRGSLLHESLHAQAESNLPADHLDETYVINELHAIKRSVQAARSCDRTSFYPVDVLCWTCLDTLKTDVLSDEPTAAFLGDCLAELTAIDPDTLDPQQTARYHSRFEAIAAKAGERVLAEQQLKKLAQYDEPLAAFFYALKVSGFLQAAPQLEGARRALAHLRERPSRLHDTRCIRIAVDLLWFAQTGERFMSGERQTLPLDGQAWQECLELTDLAMSYDSVTSLRVLFMRALALFHLGRVSQSLDAFTELGRLSQEQHDRRRIINVYLASSDDGTPKMLRARVRRVNPDFNGGRCWSEEYQRDFPFDPHQFGTDQAIVGRTLDAFVVFNMRGPLLEPPRQPGERRGPTILRPIGERKRETKDAL